MSPPAALVCSLYCYLVALRSDENLLSVILIIHVSTPGELIVSLFEVDASGPDGVVSVASLTVTNPRTINLVPGLFYHIGCRSASGFDGLDNQIWLNGSGDPVMVISDPGMEPPTGNQALYARLTNPGDLNEWTLVLQMFSENMQGTYVCQGREGANASITIGMRKYSHV